MFRKKDKHKKYDNCSKKIESLEYVTHRKLVFSPPDILRIFFEDNKYRTPRISEKDCTCLTFHNVYSFRYTEGWDVMYNLPVDPPSLYGELVYFTKQSDYIDSFLELASCYGIILDGVELTNYLVTTIDVIDIISYSEPLLEFL